MINRTEHQAYAEPFIGMGGVFLRRSIKPNAEVINDYNRALITFFRVVQRHCDAFYQQLNLQLASRSEFERMQKVHPDTLTDIERATRFYYLQKNAYGGKVDKQTFGVSADRPSRFNVPLMDQQLKDLSLRLSGVVIECLDWKEFIQRYDACRNALLY